MLAFQFVKLLFNSECYYVLLITGEGACTYPLINDKGCVGLVVLVLYFDRGAYHTSIYCHYSILGTAFKFDVVPVKILYKLLKLNQFEEIRAFNSKLKGLSITGILNEEKLLHL